MAAQSSANNANARVESAGLAQEMILAEAPVKYLYKPPKVTEDYQIKFDPSKAPIYVPTKTIVVTQDPPADQVVPAGTEVKVVLAAKGSLPVGSFQVSSGFQAKYGAGDVSLVLKDLSDKGQAVVPILEQEKEYEVLSASEKSAVVQYAQSVGLSVASEADTKAAYQDIQFFNNF